MVVGVVVVIPEAESSRSSGSLRSSSADARSG